MCISNIGNRRPFPTNGFKSRGGVDASNAGAASASSSYVHTASLKESLVLDSDSTSSSSSASACSKLNPHIIVQHDYHDHAFDNCVDYQEDHPARGGVTTPFPLKLHDMLDAVIANGHDHIVSWQPHGRCFVVHNPKEFIELLPQYFKLSKLASFQRQLNLYGFQRLTRGRDRGGYYHELFLKNRVFLAHNIQRIKVKGTGVRARSNPDQEPDFWAMPWVQEPSQQQQQPMGNVGESSSCSMLPATPSMPQQQLLQDNNDLLMLNSMPPASFFSQQFPLNLEPTALAPAYNNSYKNFDDDEIVFGDKHFHSVMDSLNNNNISSCSNSGSLLTGVDELLASEADNFFEDFDFPEEAMGNDQLEDDAVFGDLLEQMIA